MKTNLSSIYGTNKEDEANGKWFDITEDFSVKLKRMGGENGKKIAEKRALLFKPFATQIKKNTLDEATQTSLFMRVFTDAVMTDWKGLTDENGQDIPFSSDYAHKLLTEMPDLFYDLLDIAQDRHSFNIQEREELGNS